jgi:hypothetical protein
MNRIIVFFVLLTSVFSCKKETFLNWNLINQPIVKSLELKENSLQSFKLQANFESTGNDKNAKLGFIYSKSNIEPDLSNNDEIIFCELTGDGIVEKEIKWKSTNTIHCRAFIFNKIDTIYSEIIALVWQGDSSNLPEIITFIPQNVGFFSATCGAMLIDNGGLQTSRVGFIISLDQQPSISNAVILNQSSQLTNYSVEINNLQSDVTYYVRAFAENILGVHYANQIYSFQTKKYYQIGDIGPTGGIIFFNKLDTIGGWNFMECAPSDLLITAPWSTTLVPVQNLNTSIGTGKLNTQIIVGTLGLSSINYAAQLCDFYTYNGSSDWFLPSRDELLKIQQNLFLNGIGNFQSGFKYWTSSGDDFFTQNAWCQKMQNSSSSSNSISELKSINLKVRPIRWF